MSIISNIRNYSSRMIRKQRTMTELSRLSDRELNDIGISRYDIDRIVSEI